MDKSVLAAVKEFKYAGWTDLGTAQIIGLERLTKKTMIKCNYIKYVRLLLGPPNYSEPGVEPIIGIVFYHARWGWFYYNYDQLDQLIIYKWLTGVNWDDTKLTIEQMLIDL